MKAFITQQAEIISVGGNSYKFGGVEEIQAEALFRNSVVIPASTPLKEIQVANISVDKFHFLMIKASKYDDNTGKFKYSVGTHPTTYNLTAPHSFRGVGQAGYFPSLPDRFIFTNNYLDDITVEILALWDHSTSGGGGPPPPGVDRLFKDSLEVSSEGQTIFDLAYAPSYPEDTILIVEGVVQEYGASKDFTVSSNIVTWYDRHFTFSIGEWVETRYFI